MRISSWSSDVCSSDLIVLQDIVEEPHDVLDELLVAVPLVPGLEVQRRQAAHRRAVVPQMVAAGRKRDLRAEIGCRHLQAKIAVMLGHSRVHFVDEDDIGRSEEHTSEIQSLMRNSYAVLC